MTDCADPSASPGTVTTTGTWRSTVVQTAPPDPGAATKHAPPSGNTSAVGSTEAGGAPQATVRAGSPYAAFCSSPALTGRRFASWTVSGRWAITVRQTAATSSASEGAAIVTGPVAGAWGVLEARGVAPSNAPNRHRLRAPIASAMGIAIRLAVRAAPSRSARRSGSVMSEVHHRAGQRPGDAGHELDPADDHLAQFVDPVRFGQHDDLVRSGHRVDTDHPRDVADGGGDIAGSAYFGLDEDVCLDHDTSPIPSPCT